MVRVFPLYHSVALDGWLRQLTDGLHTMQKLQVRQISDELDPAAVICQRNHQIPQFGIFYGDNPFDYSFTILILEIILVILMIRVVRFFLKPLKQPRIVSEIIGAIIIGPSVLGRNKKYAEFMFPTHAIFIMRNLGLIGFMYFLFISGVKMDLGLVRRSGKKQVIIAFFGVLVPFSLVSLVGLVFRKYMDKELAKFSSIGAIASGLSLTLVPAMYFVLEELNLLSSEMGRLAMSTAIIGDAMGINCISAFEAAKQAEVSGQAALYYLISLFVFSAFIIIVVRRMMHWIVDNTPAGEPVDQAYVVAILLGVLISGFVTDMFGIAIANGPLWLGLVIPDGPPLGSTLVERSDTIIMEILMPFAFAFIGLTTDVSAMAMAGWSVLAPLFAMIIVGYLSKIIAVMIASIFVEVPLRESFALSLIMSLRGQVELVVFLHWMDKKIITVPCFTLLVLSTASITAIATPLVSIVYDPTKPYRVHKRRTIQHTAQDKELRIVLCIYDQESLPGLINLLDISNPTETSPFSVYAVRLIELDGRAAPVFIDHDKQEEPTKYSALDTIHNALKLYQEARGDLIKLHTYTAVVPKRTMYQDVCELALEKKATIIILPFHREALPRMRTVNSNVLIHTPCSVGILVDGGHIGNPLMRQSTWNSIPRFAVLFLGGADSREALAYADRMAANHDVHLTVVRFLSHNSRGDNDIEKKLDDGVVTWFWVKNESNKQVTYSEVVVKNGAETVSAIRALNDNYFDLWIVGRKQGINPVFLEGLSDWSENHELGIIGDYVASSDFNGAASVLVIQQQTLRGQVTSSGSYAAKIRSILCQF